MCRRQFFIFFHIYWWMLICLIHFMLKQTMFDLGRREAASGGHRGKHHNFHYGFEADGMRSGIAVLYSEDTSPKQRISPSGHCEGNGGKRSSSKEGCPAAGCPSYDGSYFISINLSDTSCLWSMDMSNRRYIWSIACIWTVIYVIVNTNVYRTKHSFVLLS